MPARPGPFIIANGRTCFCALSAMAANHGEVCARSMNARIAGFSPLLALEYPLPSSHMWETLRKLAPNAFPSCAGLPSTGDVRLVM
jgi:hypothetical protein